MGRLPAPGPDEAHHLPGWDKSKGARLEYHVASELGMQVFTASQITEPASSAAWRSASSCSTGQWSTPSWKAERPLRAGQ
nr:DUF4406 domain-containing protein [Pseudomonas sp. AU11447]